MSPREQRLCGLILLVWTLTGTTLYIESEYWFGSIFHKPQVHKNLLHKNFD